jgi:hypothetical protein
MAPTVLVNISKVKGNNMTAIPLRNGRKSSQTGNQRKKTNFNKLILRLSHFAGENIATKTGHAYKALAIDHKCRKIKLRLKVNKRGLY